MFSFSSYRSSVSTATYESSQSADSNRTALASFYSSWQRIAPSLADFFLRFSVALILLWYGAFKFTPSEAKAIEELLLHSPLFAWMLTLLSLQSISNLIGTIEIITALALLVPRTSSFLLLRIFSLVGGILGTVTFLATVSFLFTTPNTFRVIDGLLVPVGAGGFVIKDIVLLAVCFYHVAVYNNTSSSVFE